MDGKGIHLLRLGLGLGLAEAHVSEHVSLLRSGLLRLDLGSSLSSKVHASKHVSWSSLRGGLRSLLIHEPEPTWLLSRSLGSGGGHGTK